MLKIDDTPTYTYLMEANGLFKIGITSNVDARLSQVQTGNPHKVSMVCTKVWDTKEIAMFIEQSLHYKYQGFRLKGEWFNLTKEEVLFIVLLFTGQQLGTTQSIIKLPVIQKPTPKVKVLLNADNTDSKLALDWVTKRRPNWLENSFSKTDLNKATKNDKDKWIRQYVLDLFDEYSEGKKTMYVRKDR